jgi:DNA-binding response OmpR family regulator
MRETGTIFLVENDKDYLSAIDQAFRKANIRNPLKIARYGNEAILYLKGIGIYADRKTYPVPALIILDMTNPDGSSRSVLGWIREQEALAQIPVLVLTRAGQLEMVQDALDSGANCYVLKRDSLDELVATIQNLDLLDLRGIFEEGSALSDELDDSRQIA